MKHLRFRQYAFDRFYYWGFKNTYFTTPHFNDYNSDRFTQIQVQEQDLWENDLVMWQDILTKVWWSHTFNGWTLLNLDLNTEIPIGLYGIKIEELTIVGNIYQNQNLIDKYLSENNQAINN